MSEILVPESTKPRKPPDIDYAIRRLNRRICHNQNRCGDILLTNEAVMHIGLEALQYAKARIEALEKERDCLILAIHEWDLADSNDEVVAWVLAECAVGNHRKPGDYQAALAAQEEKT